MYIFAAQVAQSNFKISKLLNKLQQKIATIQELDCRCIYFVHSATQLTDHEIKQLSIILDSSIYEGNVLEQQDNKQYFLVLPRPGTISPWSSKATDILHNCGLHNISRVEKGINWGVKNSASNKIKVTDMRALQHAFYDRMTEVLIDNIEQAENLFATANPGSLQTVALLTQGKAVLKQANETMALGLSEPEIDYLIEYFIKAHRDPTDAELMMFAQINSEHCRHKIFNATWTLDAEQKNHSLFDMIRQTYSQNPGRVLSAYSDNSAITSGYSAPIFYADPESHEYQIRQEDCNIVVKVETHNHPTAISPYAGAATGAGGEIRDEAATGRGARPKAGLIGFSVSNLNIVDFQQPWEVDHGQPDHIASALEIMLEAPIGAASFNNEFGRPNLVGYFRTYEQKDQEDNIRGYHKPIMLAGGYGMIRGAYINKQEFPVGTKIVVLGGPAMLIGLGGGGASSTASGISDQALDFASVQRGNPEMQRRCQEVIDACWALHGSNPILSIHDVGAGGLANALTELIAQGNNQQGARFELRDIPNDDPNMSPMEIWCNESQERYVLALKADDMSLFSRFCQRERAPFAILGETTHGQQILVYDRLFNNKTVDLPIPLLLGESPPLVIDAKSKKEIYQPFDVAGIKLSEAINRILHLPAVADKSFLITIGDRSVSGLVARDQMVGPWQIPTADCAVTCSSFDSYSGEAMAIGERAPIALTNPSASGRMAVGEALTNIVAARIMGLQDIVFSANWMAACGQAGEDAKLLHTVRAVSKLSQALGICIPVGKDSLSMRTLWPDQEADNGAYKQVTAPLSLIISAFAPTTDVRKSLIPELQTDKGETRLILIDLGLGKNRLGGSCLTQVYQKISAQTPDIENIHDLKIFFQAIQLLNEMGVILAYHDRSDGGLFTTLCEMAFSSRTGIDIALHNTHDLLPVLFNEELGGVIQIRAADMDKVDAAFKTAISLQDHIHDIGTLNQSGQLSISQNGTTIFTEDIYSLQRAWSETSFKIKLLRDNPVSVRQESQHLFDKNNTGLFVDVTFDADQKIHAPYINGDAKPKIAILREQGVNGHIEMAAAFHHAEFQCVNVHMSDIIEGRLSLSAFKGLIACGGFSYGDVLGAGKGWAHSILFNDVARHEFQLFFSRPDTFGLGVCNGCQMFSYLRDIIPGAESWPVFRKNVSEQFEARLVMVEILDSKSIFMNGMQGSRLPVAVAHSEGRVEYQNVQAEKQAIATIKYIDYSGNDTEIYPGNPNGSAHGHTGFTTKDGRFTIMMPHPERVFLKQQYSWLPNSWTATNSPWMRFFYNARAWVSQQ